MFNFFKKKKLKNDGLITNVRGLKLRNQASRLQEIMKFRQEWEAKGFKVHYANKNIIAKRVKSGTNS